MSSKTIAPADPQSLEIVVALRTMSSSTKREFADRLERDVANGKFADGAAALRLAEGVRRMADEQDRVGRIAH